MGDLETYRGRPIRELVVDSVPWAESSDALVFLMGPYRLLDPAYVLPDEEYPLPDDPLAPSGDDVPADAIRATLREVAESVSAATPATVFVASDVAIPTKQEVASSGVEGPGIAVIDQSVAFAKASAGSAFVFTDAGLTTGTGAEAGAVPEYFRLRDPETRRRDPRTFCVFSEAEWQTPAQETYDPAFSSASTDEMDDAYSLRFGYFVDRAELEAKLIDFVESHVVPLP